MRNEHINPCHLWSGPRTMSEKSAEAVAELSAEGLKKKDEKAHWK